MRLHLPILFFVLGPFSSYGLECIAHRGFSSAFQENTVESMMAAWKAGADVVELDVRVLADDAVVLFHDETIADRSVETLSYDELQALTPAYHLPTLQEALKTCPEDRVLLLDLKDDTSRFMERLLVTLQEVGPECPRLMFQSRAMSVLEALSRRLEQPTLLWVTSLNREGVANTPPDPARLANLLSSKTIHGVSAKGRRFVDRTFISAFQDRGLAYYVWTINPADRIQHYRALGVDGIITDDPTLLQRGLCP